MRGFSKAAREGLVQSHGQLTTYIRSGSGLISSIDTQSPGHQAVERGDQSLAQFREVQQTLHLTDHFEQLGVRGS